MYLLRTVGRATVDALPAKLDLPPDSAPHPLLGEFLAWTNHETRFVPNGTLTLVEQMSPSGFRDLAWSLTDRFVDDLAFRDIEVRYLKNDGFDLLLRDQAALAAAVENRGTARSYARIMERVFQGAIPGAARMKEALEWPMSRERVRAEFTVLGTKGGSLPGIVTSAYYAKPAKDGAARVLALFLQNVPPRVSLRLQKSYVHQDFERRLLSDDAFVEKVRARLGALGS